MQYERRWPCHKAEEITDTVVEEMLSRWENVCALSIYGRITPKREQENISFPFL